MADLKAQLSSTLEGEPLDLALAFVSPHYGDSFDLLAELITSEIGPRHCIGCTAMGVIGGGREIEQQPALSLTVARLPDVEIDTFHLEADALPDPDVGPDAWIDALGIPPDPVPQFLLLANPMGTSAFDPRPLLMGLDFAYSRSMVIGGLASALQGNTLFIDGVVVHSGCVGLALRGNISVDPVVAQGCRAIGQPMVITGCTGHYLEGLDDRPSFEVLLELHQNLPESDQELMESNGLFLGIASTALKQELKHGDFLIRNVIQLDSSSGIIGIGDMLRPGQTVQFHLRDADTATEDLELMLQQYSGAASSPDTVGGAPTGALLFTCTGRGEHLFERPNHDSDKFTAAMGDIPLGGFFCGGEIGPVGGATHLLGYTCSFAIFRPAHD